jgi:N-acetylglutamate synthase-like GNAT family acetyltransferase
MAASRRHKPLQIRIAEIPEAPAITSLINLAFQVERFFLNADRIDLDQVRAFFETGKFLVAGEPHALSGCVYLEPRGDRAYLGLLSVHPTRQGTGLGSRLVAAVELYSRELGCRFVDLQVVNLRQELPAFYQRLGYVETEIAPFPPDIPTKLPCHLVRMAKPLD